MAEDVLPTAVPGFSPVKVQGTSMAAFGATTVALVTLATAGTGLLVSHGTSDVSGGGLARPVAGSAAADGSRVVVGRVLGGYGAARTAAPTPVAPVVDDQVVKLADALKDRGPRTVLLPLVPIGTPALPAVDLPALPVAGPPVVPLPPVTAPVTTPPVTTPPVVARPPAVTPLTDREKAQQQRDRERARVKAEREAAKAAREAEKAAREAAKAAREAAREAAAQARKDARAQHQGSGEGKHAARADKRDGKGRHSR